MTSSAALRRLEEERDMMSELGWSDQEILGHYISLYSCSTDFLVRSFAQTQIATFYDNPMGFLEAWHLEPTHSTPLIELSMRIDNKCISLVLLLLARCLLKSKDDRLKTMIKELAGEVCENSTDPEIVSVTAFISKRWSCYTSDFDIHGIAGFMAALHVYGKVFTGKSPKECDMFLLGRIVEEDAQIEGESLLEWIVLSPGALTAHVLDLLEGKSTEPFLGLGVLQARNPKLQQMQIMAHQLLQHQVDSLEAVQPSPFWYVIDVDVFLERWKDIRERVEAGNLNLVITLSLIRELDFCKAMPEARQAIRCIYYWTHQHNQILSNIYMQEHTLSGTNNLARNGLLKHHPDLITFLFETQLDVVVITRHKGLKEMINEQLGFMVLENLPD